MGEFLANSSYIFDDLHDQEIINNQVTEILESGDYSDEELETTENI
ncbi:hypothetical protein KFZ67_20715 (plasmid) [Photobacterium damselae]